MKKEHKWSWQDYIDGGPDLNTELVKIAKLDRRMKAWKSENGWMPLDSNVGRLFDKDMLFIEKCRRYVDWMKVSKDDKIRLNKIWRRYG